MRKLKTILVLSFGSLFVLPASLWCISPGTESAVKQQVEKRIYTDVIFLEGPEQEGVYSKKIGRIRELEKSYIIMEMPEGEHLLYTPRVVKLVGLHNLDPNDPNDSEGLENNWPKLIDRYWNRKPLLALVLGDTSFGRGLSVLGEYSYGFATFLGVLILFALLSYAGYRLYEIVIISTHLRDLNSTKLNMEIRKLRREIEDIEKRLGITTKVVPEQEETEYFGRKLVSYKSALSQLNIFNFVKYKILRILTEQEKSRRADVWRKRWEAYRMKKAWLPALIYYPRLLLNIAVTIFTALFSLGAFVDMFVFAHIGDEFGSFYYIFVFFAMFMISFAFFLRLNTQRRIMRKTYIEA